MELERLLASQDLEVEDIEANRAGRISKRQVDQIDSQRRRWTRMLVGLIGMMVVVGGVLAAVKYRDSGDAAVFVVPGALLAMGLVIYGIYVAVLRLPTGVADRKVTMIEAPFAKLMVVPTRSQYLVSLNGVYYRGLTGKLSSEASNKTLKAYVIADTKIIVAVEPP